MMSLLDFFSQKLPRQGCSWFPKFLQLSCLKPKYTLRRQLVAGYGITAFVTVFIVVLMATIAAQRAGSKVRDGSIELFQTQLDAILQESGVFTGDILDKKMNGLRGSVHLLTEIVRDRIVGYPNDGWENDTHVPFVDRETGRRIYPLKADLLPQDFGIISNIDPNNTANLNENLQERGVGDYQMQVLTNSNTESAMFNFQGNCDPSLTNPEELGYYPFCTEENNDASLGGKINPTTTLAPLEQKAADIGVFTKAIFEAQPLAHSIGVWFVNSGAGAGVTFPSFAAPKGLESMSEGCDWMRVTNNYTGRPLGTEEEINRCTPAGARSSIREYNGLERAWCADQALHPGETRIFGPYAGLTFLSWRLTVGRAVFDRKTNELIACTYLHLSLVQAEKILADITKCLTSDTVVTRLDGTVVVGANKTDDNGNISNHAPKLWETDFIDFETYRKLTDDLAFWEGEWDIESAQNKYNFSVKSDGNYFTVFPSPIPPDVYDPLYRPDFFIFGSINAEEQDKKIEEIDDIISSDINDVIILSLTFGAIGLCCMMAVITIVAQVLTKPLKWMENKAQEIVYHTDKREGYSLIVANEDDSEIHFWSFMPKTEIHELVSEFRSMISGFSGEGASTVAVPRHTETKNLVTWKEDFRKFYNLGPNLEHKLKEEMNMMTRSVSRRMSKKSAMRAGSMRRSSMGRSSIQRSLTRRPSNRRYSNRGSSSGRNSLGFRNSASFPLSNSDFEQISAAADEADEGDGVSAIMVDGSLPIFQSTQISGESTIESRAQPANSEALKSSGILPTRSSELLKYDPDQFPRPPTRINNGSIIQHPADGRSSSFQEEKCMYEHSIRIVRSPLYWNVLSWIVVPLLAAIIATMTLVGSQLTNKFPKWINEASNASFALEVQYLNSSAGLIKNHVEEIFVGPLQDLHTIHRMSGWLLFGAVNRSDGFTDIEMELTEECKYYENPSECPFQTSDTRSPCPCEWNDPWERTCNKTGNLKPLGDPRYLQKLWYLNQVRNTNQTYPNSSYDSESTSWYTDPDQMQGSDKGSDADGHSTAYDRVRAASALSTIIFPVYNYGSEVRADGSSTSAMSGYISFDADGAYGGFSGCNYDAAGYAHFVSSDANDAYNISDNCPEGKFGYDPRCREWYDEAKRGGLENDDGVYITPPYRYATDDDIGNTAVSPLIDPKSGEFVGNTLIDFKTSEIANVIDKSTIKFYAVILPNATDGQHVILSSESTDESTPRSIHEVLAPNDPPGTPNHDRFEEIFQGMENEGSGENCNLYRKDQNGVNHEFCYAYKPIFITELRPVQPDDFRRGAVHSTEFLYSIIMFQEVKDLTSEFMKRSDDIDRLLQRTYIIYMLYTGLTALIFIFVTATISLLVTRPTIQLLRTVKQVNAGGIEDDMPPLTGGSREVHRVYASFAKLYKTVRMSNSAFFVGDLSLAHRMGLDALRLFRKIGDQKAIAISCNNMGNTLLAWMVECREPGTSLELEGDDCTYCTEAAIKYYTEAVTLGTKDFEGATGDAEKARFAQQLADRHFNRAMCLLLTADDPCASSDAKENALDDLYLVKQYDQGVKEYMLHSKTLLENSDVIFERSLRRLHGLTALIDIEPDVWNVWDIYELVDEADLMLQAAWNQDEAPLFHNMTKIGRLQELEGTVTGIELSSGKADDAVEMATRMLIEDEFLLDSSFIEVADCILLSSREFREAEDDEDNQKEREEQQERAFHDGSIAGLKQEFKTMRKPGMRNALDIGRAFVFCIDLKGEWNGQALLLDLRKVILEFYQDNFQPNDTVGIVTFDPKDGTLHKVQPSSAKDLLAASNTNSNQYPHRDALVAATTGVACSRFIPALQGGIDMALEVELSSASDVCLLYVSDGGAYDETIYSRLQHRIEASSRTGNAHIRSSSRSISMASSIDLVVIDLGPSQEDFTNRSSIQSIKKLVQQHSSFKERPVPTPPTLSFEASCKSLVTATRSRASVYLRADADHLDESFRKATASINEGTSFAGNRLQRALTMQKF